MNRSRILYGLGLAILASGVSAGVLLAQVSGVTSEPVGRGSGEVPAPQEIPAGPTDIVTSRVTLAPEGIVSWHTHPGPVAVTVLQGKLTIEDCLGQKPFAAGAAFIIPAGHLHQDRNLTTEEVEILATYIVPPGRELREHVDPPTC